MAVVQAQFNPHFHPLPFGENVPLLQNRANYFVPVRILYAYCFQKWIDSISQTE